MACQYTNWFFTGSHDKTPPPSIHLVSMSCGCNTGEMKYATVTK